MQIVIDTICREYPGKTVFMVSHGYPTRIIQELLTSKIDSKNIKNADTRTFILDVANKNLLNLHKPYIDSVLLKNPKATKAKKVLGVHGR
jgi:broad specificity phosphatase PhoE